MGQAIQTLAGELPSQVWLLEVAPVSLFWERYCISYFADSFRVCESLLVWTLPWDQFALGAIAYHELLPLTTQLPGSQGHTNPSTYHIKVPIFGEGI